MLAQRANQEPAVFQAAALAHQVAQIRTVKAGDEFIGIAQRKLRENVVPHMPRGAGREGRDRRIRKRSPQAAQLPVLGTELVSPLGNAVSFINGEKSDGNM